MLSRLRARTGILLAAPALSLTLVSSVTADEAPPPPDPEPGRTVQRIKPEHTGGMTGTWRVNAARDSASQVRVSGAATVEGGDPFPAVMRLTCLTRTLEVVCQTEVPVAAESQAAARRACYARARRAIRTVRSRRARSARSKRIARAKVRRARARRSDCLARASAANGSTRAVVHGRAADGSAAPVYEVVAELVRSTDGLKVSSSGALGVP